MKKILIFLILLYSAFSFVSAQKVPQLNAGILSTELFSTSVPTYRLTPLLSEDERDNRNDKLIGVLLNILLPGLGSFVIGDTVGGVICLSGQVISAAAFWTSFGLYISYINNPNDSLVPIIDVLAYGGLAGVAVFSIIGIIAPFIYVNNRTSEE